MYKTDSLIEFIESVDKDTLVWLIDDIIDGRFSEADMLAKEIYCNELDISDADVTDIQPSLRKTLEKALWYRIGLHGKAIQPVKNTVSMCKFTAPEFIISDQDAWEDLLTQPELILA